MDALAAVPASLQADLRALDVELTGDDLAQLGQFLDLLLAANREFNLTGIKDVGEAWGRHVLDSLSLLGPLGREDVASVIDLGSGGGLPGIPLAITMPQATFTLVEATTKKAAFLADAADALSLSNVTVLAERAELIGTPDGGFRSTVDAVVARAVGPLTVLLELALPLVVEGGRVLAIKGQKAGEEIEAAAAALRTLKGSVEGTTRTGTGTIIEIRKTAATPKRYPRLPGVPKRDPIGSSS